MILILSIKNEVSYILINSWCMCSLAKFDNIIFKEVVLTNAKC